MAQIKVLFWLDVEDFINPESEEALLALLDLLDNRGITGIFKFVGEKIRQLEKRKRTDIIERLKKHDIGYHTNWHSVHPVVSEYLEPLGFREGAEEFERREGSGYADLLRVTGGPVNCYGQPGPAWAAQPYPVLNKWNIRAYLDSHDQVTFDGRPFWYGGLLNLTSLTGLMGLPLQDGALEKAKRTFDRLCDEQQDENVGFISIVYHPTEFVFSQFWDAVNFSKGNNPPPDQWKKPAFRAPGDMERYIQMVGEFIDYTLSRDNVSYVGTDDVLQLEKSRHRMLEETEIIALAKQTGNTLNYAVHNQLSLSASELFWVFRQTLLGLSPLPELIYGPEREFPSSDANQEVGVADVIEAISRDLPTVCGFKQLPDYFDIAGHKVSPIDLTCTMAAIIRGKLAENESIRLVKGTLEPVKHASNEGDWVKYWPIFPEDMSVTNIVAQSRLQTWTLKPALF